MNTLSLSNPRRPSNWLRGLGLAGLAAGLWALSSASQAHALDGCNKPVAVIKKAVVVKKPVPQKRPVLVAQKPVQVQRAVLVQQPVLVVLQQRQRPVRWVRAVRSDHAHDGYGATAVLVTPRPVVYQRWDEAYPRHGRRHWRDQRGEGRYDGRYEGRYEGRYGDRR